MLRDTVLIVEYLQLHLLFGRYLHGGVVAQSHFCLNLILHDLETLNDHFLFYLEIWIV